MGFRCQNGCECCRVNIKISINEFIIAAHLVISMNLKNMVYARNLLLIDVNDKNGGASLPVRHIANG